MLIPNVSIPEGQYGSWRVERFEVTPQQASFHNLRAMINAHRGETMIEAGTYTRLVRVIKAGAVVRSQQIVMSDTPGEKQDHRAFVLAARGHVLIAGLGLGMVANAVAPRVESVTVVEVDPDVIALVGPHLLQQHPNLVIVQADVYTWQPPRGRRWDCAWFDIWDDICEDNLLEMKQLKDRYRRRVRHIDFWSLDHFARRL